MERVRISFSAHDRPERSGALAIDDRGHVTLRASAEFAAALEAAVADPRQDLSPLHTTDRARGLAFAASLAKGMPAKLLEAELVVGALELRAFLGAWARLSLQPGDFDPDEAWDFVLAVNEATLEAPRP